MFVFFWGGVGGVLQTYWANNLYMSEMSSNILQELSHLVHMTGISHAQTMYVEGNDPLDVSIESIALDANDLKNDTGERS